MNDLTILASGVHGVLGVGMGDGMNIEDILERAAKAVEAYAEELEARAPSEDDADLQERTMVYAKHVRRAARRVRLLKEGK